MLPAEPAGPGARRHGPADTGERLSARAGRPPGRCDGTAARQRSRKPPRKRRKKPPSCGSGGAGGGAGRRCRPTGSSESARSNWSMTSASSQSSDSLLCRKKPPRPASRITLLSSPDGPCVLPSGLRLSAGRIMLRHRLIVRAELAGDAGTRGVALLFGAVNARIADGVVKLADRWKPDLVVHEPLAVAGALAAAHRGVPAVLHENSLWDGAGPVRGTTPGLGKPPRRPGVAEGAPPAPPLTLAPPRGGGAPPRRAMRRVPDSRD